MVSFTTTARAWALVALFPGIPYAWMPTAIGNHRCCVALRRMADSDWSVTDDWNGLSDSNQVPDSDTLFNTDVAQLTALRMQNFGMDSPQDPQSPEEELMNDAIDTINTEITQEDNVALNTDSFEDDMGREIAMLVRCNQDPQALLLAEGRAVPELTKEQRTNVRQLVEFENGKVAATTFLREATGQMFKKHSTKHGNEAVLGKAGVAAWMEQSTGEAVGQHDKRVQKTIAHFGSFGKGYLTRDEFTHVYEISIAGYNEPVTAEDLERFRAPEIDAVWRDLANHGIVSPAEFERNMKLAELRAKIGEMEENSSVFPNLLDECEIIDDLDDHEVSMTTDKQGKSSHERVELVKAKGGDGKPVSVWMKDGDFVFIDETSCIGCTQCASAAPASFQMLESSGRARTFFQRKAPDVVTAVNSCPVDCMHMVSFDELKELEVARDEGVNDDHRHFGHSSTRGYIAATPLHVSRRDSDANHRSSFYHFLKNKCFKSTQCPQRGCFDCPRYKEKPGSNPFFQERLKRATHMRADYFKKSGQADSYRKTADL